jgi:hypothetical protein
MQTANSTVIKPAQGAINRAVNQQPSMPGLHLLRINDFWRLGRVRNVLHCDRLDSSSLEVLHADYKAGLSYKN